MSPVYKSNLLFVLEDRDNILKNVSWTLFYMIIISLTQCFRRFDFIKLLVGNM